jgi:cytochrome c-type biogenesis protein CcmH/NrfG
MVGYELLRAGRVDDAIVIFELQVRQHPDSWNAWDSLGEGYMRRGDIKSAVDHYEHSLKLNPANSNGVRMLEKLRGK